jgi:hypothetical protein
MGKNEAYFDKKFFENTENQDGMFFKKSASWLLPEVKDKEDMTIETFYIATKDSKAGTSDFSLFYQNVGYNDIAQVYKLSLGRNNTIAEIICLVVCILMFVGGCVCFKV